MPATFRLIALDHERFENLFALDDRQLRAIGAERRIADAPTGYPCRVSLEDAAVGDELLLLPFEHQPADSPYRASGPIFVRKGVIRRDLPPGDVPPYVTRRLISIRAYDTAHRIVSGRVCQGVDVARELEALCLDRAVAYAHLHNAAYGCFSCRVERC
ncbi:DUF1203 domain-containing protein [Dokdonella sp. MW10]|uniref:DUF1203 domain-containing protein n=1 Tax=Dokdonella sp. MW10 TaxID=2992926 RepID=UPI003F8100B2